MAQKNPEDAVSAGSVRSSLFFFPKPVQKHPEWASGIEFHCASRGAMRLYPPSHLSTLCTSCAPLKL